ncbi:MAG: hypothetical protein CMM01_16050 [Rhodopirellula sp.]|nr:hypothetical protein [Rhodopirellula sp.]
MKQENAKQETVKNSRPPAKSLWLPDGVWYISMVFTAPKCVEIAFFALKSLQPASRRSHHQCNFPRPSRSHAPPRLRLSIDAVTLSLDANKSEKAADDDDLQSTLFTPKRTLIA